ncbi:MAG: hypothetical protein IJF20_01520 [Clostridia bacterium]|nr:hypothetical protein [Clostridia bacterium]
MKGYSFTGENLFYMIKKHYCPVCGDKLLRKKVSEIVNSELPESKNYNFEVADSIVKGDMKFTHIEFYCNQCNKYYTVKEAKKNKF